MYERKECLFSGVVACIHIDEREGVHICVDPDDAVLHCIGCWIVRASVSVSDLCHHIIEQGLSLLALELIIGKRQELFTILSCVLQFGAYGIDSQIDLCGVLRL